MFCQVLAFSVESCTLPAQRRRCCRSSDDGASQTRHRRARTTARRRRHRPRAATRRRRRGARPSALVARAPSSTRSTRAASPTATATASATSPASGRASPTCATSASTPSGSRPGTAPRSPTAATTSPTTGRSTRRSAPSRRPRRSSPRPPALGHPDHRRRRPQPRLGPAPVVPGRARRRPGSPERRGSGSARAAAPDGDEMPTDWRSNFSGTDLDADRRTPTARPASGTCTCSRPQQPDLNWDHPDVRREHEDDPPLLVRPRRRPAIRIDSAALLVKDPTLPEIPAEPGPGRASQHRPRRAPRHLPQLARRSPTRYPGTRVLVGELWLARRRAVRASTCARTSSTPPSTSTSWPGRGTPTALRDSIDATLAAHAPVGAPATWLLSNHDVTRPVTRYGREDIVVRLRLASAAAPRPTSTLGTRRARAAALLCAALPGSLYIYQGDELGLDGGRRTCPPSSSQDPMHFRSGGVDPGPRRLPRAAALVRRRAAVRLQPGRRAGASRGCRQPDDWAALTVEAAAGRPGLDAQPLSRRAAHPPLRARTSATGRCAGSTRPGRRPRLRARRPGSSCVTNLSPGRRRAAARRASVLLASAAARRRAAAGRRHGVAPDRSRDPRRAPGWPTREADEEELMTPTPRVGPTTGTPIQHVVGRMQRKE